MDQTKIDTLRAQPVPCFSHLIDGQQVAASDGATMEVLSPIDGQALTRIARGTATDMERAITSARAAFEDRRWADQPPAARKKVLMKWADLIEADALNLAVLGVRDNGTEISMALKAEPGSAAATIRYYAEALDKIYGEIAPTAGDILGMIHKEPVGVVGAIIPWNFPMMIGAWKLAPALAMGNSVVLKPSEMASLSLMRMAELALEAGLPPGVLNAVTGEGAVVGETLGLSMDVDVLVFTGSGQTGRRLMEYAARSNLKRVYLELGGKSPNIVFADAPDLTEAAKVTAAGIFRNAGQVCVAGSRLLVEASIHDAFVEEVVKAAQAMRVGDPLRLDTQIGAINSEAQLARNLQCVAKAEAEGGQIVTGGQRLLPETGGSYMAPTIVTGVTPDATLAQEEVFGPVLAVTPFETDAEALRIANATVYGLAGAVWTSGLSRAHRIVRGVRTGVMHVNTYGGADGTVPLGGVGQSGNGADKSLHAIDKYINLKTAWMKL
ncbi:gamma-glutamyl-gamma-aminobutyraldehyde dehydrogenase PuuC [Phaeobacter piscinae]|uniref:Gamma-glutamyl-gamma-aminobutyraldehyde dehydrogenase PuuC n=1 Tax=Phaeobacter piscinae TaxID=1580596 RepID=A0ABN5DBM3_9RHOB|nr:aldehyde dehydrogenase [Phaeobacter piscinae]ATG34198.1 gamma-glutamyl-gamma-aminobutyraldehyde dehydrogenase PuuC [Phaeobacter piscinae]AUQ84718.1 gamma-glutamyl-gamma-aminobutyraldehyde dehydrogenase PuuC [Phaeobacter piscinae]AUR22602.1 gamma-glutamyl-gamma-aminobutyraldehyde dehydrogenase PuuC [Phaeobacter piscinae]